MGGTKLFITMGWGLFTFLPLYVGYNAAREFKGTPILGAIAGSMSLELFQQCHFFLKQMLAKY